MTNSEIWQFGTRAAVAFTSTAFMAIERVSKSPGRFGIYMDNQIGVTLNEARTGTITGLIWVLSFSILRNFIKDTNLAIFLSSLPVVAINSLLSAHEINGFGGNGMNPPELAPFVLGFLGVACTVELCIKKFSQIGD